MHVTQRADRNQIRSKPISNAGVSPRTRDHFNQHFEGLRSLALVLPRRQVAKVYLAALPFSSACMTVPHPGSSAESLRHVNCPATKVRDNERTPGRAEFMNSDNSSRAQILCTFRFASPPENLSRVHTTAPVTDLRSSLRFLRDVWHARKTIEIGRAHV